MPLIPTCHGFPLEDPSVFTFRTPLGGGRHLPLWWIFFLTCRDILPIEEARLPTIAIQIPNNS